MGFIYFLSLGYDSKVNIIRDFYDFCFENGYTVFFSPVEQIISKL